MRAGLLVLLLAGCGGNAIDEAMARMQITRDRMCACTELACAEAAQAEMRDWRRANRAKLEESRPTEAFARRFKTLEDEATACKQKLATAERGPP